MLWSAAATVAELLASYYLNGYQHCPGLNSQSGCIMCVKVYMLQILQQTIGSEGVLYNQTTISPLRIPPHDTIAGSSIPLATQAQFPQPGEVLREGQGVVPQSAPTRFRNELSVEYNWTSVVKIVSFYS